MDRGVVGYVVFMGEVLNIVDVYIDSCFNCDVDF